jgi:hypothetical protein
MQLVSKQRFGKHVSAATDNNATTEERRVLIETIGATIEELSFLLVRAEGLSTGQF